MVGDVGQFIVPVLLLIIALTLLYEMALFFRLPAVIFGKSAKFLVSQRVTVSSDH